MKPQHLTANQIEAGDYLWWNGTIDKIIPVLVVKITKTNNMVQLSVLQFNGQIKHADFGAKLTLMKLIMNND